MWWENKKTMKGIVNHEHEGKKWESKYSKSTGNDIEDVVLVDLDMVDFWCSHILIIHELLTKSISF